MCSIAISITGSNWKEFLRETFQFTYQDLLSKTLHLQMVNMYFFTQLEEIINNTPQAPKSTT